ncbi:MAG: S1 family peptidase [Actinomycetota bacterium]|nr:S1 family peptidase [Actinomycetota bacterium]
MNGEEPPGIDPREESRYRSLAATLRGRHEDEFLRDPNVLALGYGRRTAQNDVTDVPALVVYVTKKTAKPFLPPNRMLPRRLHLGAEGLDVDVVETGPIYPLAFTTRDRPAPSGISIGRGPQDTGTLGCLVTDRTDGALCLLSNNHVIAGQNAAPLGDAITQPGQFVDGGTDPADRIATLKRFVALTTMGPNQVDAAIGDVVNDPDVVNQVKNNLVPVASADHPAVGLLFAGGCNRTIMNPIDTVLTALNIELPGAPPGATVAPAIGMNVEKVGRTTEYTTSTVKEIDVTIDITYNMGPCRMTGQFGTAYFSQGGDSGSVVYRGGAGGNEDLCGLGGGCFLMSVGQDVLGTELRREAAEAREVRDKFLKQTRTGRFLIRVYSHNHERLMDRQAETEIAEEDRAFARGLYENFGELARASFFGPTAGQTRITAAHTAVARDCVKRAKKYAFEDEKAALDRLVEVGGRMEGKTVGEVLAALNDEALYQEVRAIVRSIEFLEMPIEGPKPLRRPPPG